MTLAIDRKAWWRSCSTASAASPRAADVVLVGERRRPLAVAFDAKEAKRICGEGLRAARARWRAVRDGRPLEIELLTNSGNRLRESAMVKSRSSSRDRRSRARADARDADARPQGLGVTSTPTWRLEDARQHRPEADLRVVGVPPAATTSSLRVAEVDGLLERLEAVSDWKGMKPLFASLEQTIHRDQPYTFLYETQRLAVAGRARGSRDRHPSDSLAHLDRWWLRP